MATTIQNRNTKIDSVKTILIFLVILGHALQNRGVGMMNDINMCAKTIIFAFHMPLFILISGYFCNTTCTTKQLFQGIGELFATYVVFQTIRIIIACKFNLMACLTPQYTLWYLLCLIYWRFLYYFLSQKLSIKTILIISIIISLCSGFIDIKILSFQRACAFFPFFVLGGYFRKHNILTRIGQRTSYIYICLLIICIGMYIILHRVFDINLLSIFRADSGYNQPYELLLRFTWIVLSSLICISLYKLLPDSEHLSKYGSATLAIYLLHSFFTKEVGWLLHHHLFHNDILSNIVFATAVFFICYYLGKLKLVQRLIRPLRLK